MNDPDTGVLKPIPKHMIMIIEGNLAVDLREIANEMLKNGATPFYDSGPKIFWIKGNRETLKFELKEKRDARVFNMAGTYTATNSKGKIIEIEVLNP